MSVQIVARISNYDQLATMFKLAPARMTREIGVAVERVLTKLENTAKKEAPVNKQSGGGSLRQSIKHFMIGPASGKIEVGAPYAVFVHEGTRPHTITVVNKKVLANKRTNQIFGKVVMHPGTKANPFLQRAVDSQQEFINNEFVKAVQRVLTLK